MGFRRRHFLIAAIAATTLAGCGGSSSNPFDNPAPIANQPGSTTGQKLSFVYFQKCINPIFLKDLPAQGGGTNTCAGSGCHALTGSGGALRLVPTATAVDLTNAANTPDVVRTSDMYKNYYSSQGEVVVGSTTQSRLLLKPQLLGVLHGGWLGLFDIVTHPQQRGQGYAQRLIRQLLDWGAAQGAQGAYLQVMLNNPPALALYQRLGFTEAYRYWYRVKE